MKQTSPDTKIIAKPGTVVEFRERLVGQHYPRGVGRSVSGESFEAFADIDDALDLRIVLVGGRHVG